MDRRTWIVTLALLAACNRPPAPSEEAQLHASTGQVKPAAGSAVSHYAAARFADQASFGATPALVAEIERMGFGPWIDAQFALPVSTINAAPIKIINTNDPAQSQFAGNYTNTQLYEAMLTSPDQLRHRVSWALSQWVTISLRKIDGYGVLLYANLLQQNALGNYATLLRAASVSPAMGEYLDNLQNRPTSPECPACAPNENYARELMQLFTLGVVKLNADGTVQRDAQRLPLETYTQKDVEELARALTGWTHDNPPNGYDMGRYERDLIPDPWEPTHDRGAKLVLGKTIAAGGGASADLDAVVKLLMGHQNIAPFVSLRLIQHLVTSNPSPAYLGRVAAVFANNGQGVAGDLKAVVKTVLLDPEARRGDQLGADSNAFGKMREPVLWYTGLLRGLGCSTPIHDPEKGYVEQSGAQAPLTPASVFSFYAPTDRAPGSNLLAPEQRLLNASELSGRLNGNRINDATRAALSGCSGSNALSAALASSPTAFADLVSERFFRGAMPIVLRQNLVDLAPETNGDTPHQKAVNLLLYGLTTPYYGVIR
ncbi:MAG: DUF1800 domain-containing protein [Pseudomonadota bacterium]